MCTFLFASPIVGLLGDFYALFQHLLKYTIRHRLYQSTHQSEATHTTEKEQEQTKKNPQNTI